MKSGIISCVPGVGLVVASLTFLVVFGAGRALAVDYAAYHNYTSAEHQAQFSTLSTSGYRMISLSTHGDPNSPLYSAVWVKRSGPNYAAAHDLTGAEYQDFADTWHSLGYIPTIVTACGSGSNVNFACVFEEKNVNIVAGHGMTETEFRDQCTWAHQNNYILTWADEYGTSGEPRYIGVWEENTTGLFWHYGTNDTVQEFQDRFDAQTSQWLRPHLASVSPGQRYLSIWVDNQIGDWVARHNMTAEEYQDEFDTWTGEGFYPIRVNAGGTGNSTRFAAVFAKSETPVARTWRMTGTPVRTLAAFDRAVENYMRANNIRGAALAVAKDCDLKLARGYTWAEPDYPDIQPTTTFRIASLAKPITAIAIHQLIQADPATDLNTTIQSILNLSPPAGQTADSDLANVRLWHVLSHLGGWDIDQLDYDPMFYNNTISQALNDALPISKDSIATFMTGQTIHNTPGNTYKYSNYGYSLLGQILEQKYGGTYTNIVKNNIFDEFGATRPRLGRSVKALQGADEARYHSTVPSISSSVMSPEQPWVPFQYGGMNIENFDSHGGWVMAAPDYTRVLSTFSQGANNPLLDEDMVDTMFENPTGQQGTNRRRGWFSANVGGGVTAYGHNGAIRGTATLAYWRDDNVSLALFFNTDTPTLWMTGAQMGDALNAAIDAADASNGWPNHDLYPAMGLEPCPPAVAIPDFDGDGQILSPDLPHFIDKIYRGDSGSDLNGDGRTDSIDAYLFGSMWGDVVRVRTKESPE